MADVTIVPNEESASGGWPNITINLGAGPQGRDGASVTGLSVVDGGLCITYDDGEDEQ